MGVAWTFVGAAGEFYTGIPPRDLTADEFAALDEAAKVAVRSGVLYRPVGAPVLAAGAAGDGSPVENTGRKGKVS